MNTNEPVGIQAQAIHDAEVRIRKILLDLVNDYDLEIDVVDVDTRSYANLRVTIQATDKRKAGR